MNRPSLTAVNPRSPRGFTLLELVVVLALIGMIFGGAVAMYVVTSSERKLKSAASDIELLAKRARATAIVQQTPYAITVFENSLRLSPLVEANFSDQQVKERLAVEEELRNSGRSTPKFAPVREKVSLADFELSVRRWGSNDFVPMLRNDPEVWRFDPNGISEPMTVRLDYEDGWIELDFHPLSATVRDRMMEAKR
jgi:prepilin-type N-terminal cleavage/methylation domain-containing protein